MAFDLGNILVHLRADAGQYNKVMRQVENRMQTTSRKLSSAGKMMMMRVSAPLAAVAAMSVKAFVGYEKQLASVSTMLDKQTMHYMPKYARALKTMAMEYGKVQKHYLKVFMIFYLPVWMHPRRLMF